MEQYKVTVVCDKDFYGSCHDRQFMLVFLRSTFIHCIPPSPEEYTRIITVHRKQCLVIGQEHWNDCQYYSDGNRAGHLKDLKTDTFLVLFDVKNRKMFEKVRTTWIPKIRSYISHRNKPIIIVATEIESRTNPQLDTVSSIEVYEMAKEMGTSYWETSANRCFGITECYHHAVELAMLNKGLKRGVMGFITRSTILPPLRPPADPEPIIKALPSTFVEEWLQTLSNPKFHDIRFVLGQRYFLTHRAILCSASTFFRKMLLPVQSDVAKSKDEDKITGISSICQDGTETVIELSPNINLKTFINMLEKMYTDVWSANELTDVNDFDQFISHFQEVEKTSKVSDEKVNSMRELFNEGIFSDVSFNVKGKKLAAHKVVLFTRCPALADIVESGLVQEESMTEIPISDARAESFKIFIEFLYTDQVQLDDSSDVIGVLSLAHRYGAQRLVTLCELHLRKELDKIMWHELYMKDEDLLNAVQLLTSYKTCHASQLVNWCRYYISQNYSKYCDREGLSFLDWEDREFIKQHRWPPLSFMNEMDEFETKFFL